MESCVFLLWTQGAGEDDPHLKRDGGWDRDDEALTGFGLFSFLFFVVYILMLRLIGFVL